MKIEEPKDKTFALRKEKLYFLNDIFFWVQMRKEAVRQVPDTGF